MKTLIIGGNRFVGLRLCMLLDKDKNCDLSILNRTGQAAHVKNAAIHKGTRDNLGGALIDKEWDVVVDFACYNYMQARSSIDHFTKVGRYIHISTSSVYDEGQRLREEEQFDPFHWPQHEVPTEAEKANPYQFGKRQAEAAFMQEAKFPALLVRFPFILGIDDYTQRLNFHVERIEKGQSIYLPNPDAHISMVDSTDAAGFLHWSLNQAQTGPMNVASPQDIQLRKLLAQIERRVGRQAQIVNQTSLDNQSPYGVSADASVNVKRMQTAGFATRPLDAWLPDLIDSLASSDGSRLH